MNVDALQKAMDAGEVFVHYPVAGRGKKRPLRDGRIMANEKTLSVDEFGFPIADLVAVVTREEKGFATVYVLYPVSHPAVCNLWIGPLDVLTEEVEAFDEED